MSIELLITTLCPRGHLYAEAFERAIIVAGLETDLEKDHFLAQVFHESCGLTVLVENLNYSAEGLLKTFPKYFDATTAPMYHRNPVAIGNRVYSNRMGNGPVSSGEGYRFRGHGFIQLTGKNNIRAYSKHAYGDDRVLANPKLLTEPRDAAHSAVWFWRVNLCKKYALRDDIRAVSGIVNAGSPTAPKINGLADRIRWLEKIRLERRRILRV